MVPEEWLYEDGDFGKGLSRLGHLSNAWYHHTRWMRPWFWQFCLRERESSAWGSWVSTVWCRTKGHPNGEIFYNPGGLEPDHRCKDCGEVVG